VNDAKKPSVPPPDPSAGRGEKAPKPKPSKRGPGHLVEVRRMHRRDINRAWEFLKLVFRGVNQKTVEYQRPRSKSRFEEVYDDEGVDQLLYVIGDEIVGYTECSYSPTGTDNWMNPRYFDKRGMRPLFVDEIAVHPLHQGHGVGAFMLDQLQHLARTRGCTHLVLEVAENNKAALTWYNKRNFFRLDAAIFLAQKVPVEPELLPPRVIKRRNHSGAKTPPAAKSTPPANGVPKRFVGREEEE
jgi:ribosomal protein S18 acetylase RimI-like enzyme